MCLLSDDIYDYNFVSQGKTTIPNVDDNEECALTDVSLKHANNTSIDITFWFWLYWWFIWVVSEI